MRTAIQHPEVVRKLVLISTPYKREGIHPEFRSGMEAMTAESAELMLETPMYQFYASVAPNLENWPTLAGKLGEMMAQDYDWSAEIETMTTPTLIVQGDSDMLSPQQGVELFGLRGGGVAGVFAPMPNSQLAVLPNTTHFDILYRTDLLIPIISGFFNPPTPPAQ